MGSRRFIQSRASESQFDQDNLEDEEEFLDPNMFQKKKTVRMSKRKLTLALKSKMKNYSAEDKSHGFVLELYFFKAVNVTVNLQEIKENPLKGKTVIMRGGEDEFREELFSYEDIQDRKSLYMILKIEDGETNLRSKLLLVNTRPHLYIRCFGQGLKIHE